MSLNTNQAIALGFFYELEIKSKFRKADKNGDGMIDFNEFKILLKEKGFNASEKELETAFKYFDTDNNNIIDQFGNYFPHLYLLLGNFAQYEIF